MHSTGSTGASRMAPQRERALVSAARTDPRAFAELYDYYLPRIYGFIFRRVQERTVAEDITATTFQRGLEALRRGTFRNDAFGGWLYRVAANSVVDHVRAGSRVVALDDSEPFDAEPSLAAFTSSLERDELRTAMRTLGYRTQNDLAHAIGVSRSAVSLWLEGKVGVPRPVAMLLRMLVAAQRRAF